MNRKRYPALGLSIIVLARIAAAAEAPRPRVAPLLDKANAAKYEMGKKADFLGVFTHVEPAFEMPDKLASMKQVIENNPFVVGFTLKIQWKQFHPQPDVVDWDGLEALVSTAAEAGKLVNIALIPGGGSPDWIYDFGAKKLENLRAGARTVTAPVPWDYRYLELYWGDLRRIQSKYADDPRVWAIELLGHNFNNVGEEMHAPSPEILEPYGWSTYKVLENWKVWIDLYDEMFPQKKLILVVSQGYRGHDEVQEEVVRYFVNKCQGRAILMSHQLHGRGDVRGFGPQMAQKYSEFAPNAHELAASLKEIPERQGTMAMTIFNVVQCGNPLFIQIWRRDADDPQYAKTVLDAWNHYGWLSPEGIKNELEEEGLYISRENATRSIGFTNSDLPRTPPPGYPGSQGE